MQCYLPHQIEPFFEETTNYYPRDDWHYNASCKIEALRVKDDFHFWRQICMSWYTPEELRMDEEKRVQHTIRHARLIKHLDESKEHLKE